MIFLIIVTCLSCKTHLYSRTDNDISLSNRIEEWKRASMKNLNEQGHDSLSYYQKQLIRGAESRINFISRDSLSSYVDFNKLLYPYYDSLIISESHYEGEISTSQYIIIVFKGKSVTQHIIEQEFSNYKLSSNSLSFEQTTRFIDYLKENPPPVRCRSGDYTATNFSAISFFTRSNVRSWIILASCRSYLMELYEPLRE